MVEHLVANERVAGSNLVSRSKRFEGRADLGRLFVVSGYKISRTMARRDLDQWLWQVGAELQKLSEEMLPNAPKVARNRGWEPNVDLLESEDLLLLRVELAGVRPEELRITVDAERNTLALKGKRPNPIRLEKPRGAHLLEIFYGDFERSIELPEREWDLENMTAEFRDGLLTIVLPKVGAQSSFAVRRTIKIQKI